MSNRIVINGVEISGDLAGRSISVRNGEVIIDGKVYEGLPEAKIINIEVTGNVDQVGNMSGGVKVTGNAGSINTTSGDVSVGGDVSGSVNSVSGDIRAKAISGSCRTVSGDIFRA